MATGQTLGAYIKGCRMATAEQLVLHSDLPIWRIGELSGYSGETAFSRAFLRCKGQRPQELRRSLKPASGSRPTGKRVELDRSGFWCRAWNGALGPDENRALGYRLQAMQGRDL